MKKIKDFFKVYESAETAAVFEQNEYESNRLSVRVIFVCAGILAVAWVLNFIGVFTVDKTRMRLLPPWGFWSFPCRWDCTMRSTAKSDGSSM